MVFLPVKPLGPFEHVHEGKNKWLKYCRPEFYDVLFLSVRLTGVETLESC